MYMYVVASQKFVQRNLTSIAYETKVFLVKNYDVYGSGLCIGYTPRTRLLWDLSYRATHTTAILYIFVLEVNNMPGGILSKINDLLFCNLIGQFGLVMVELMLSEFVFVFVCRPSST